MYPSHVVPSAHPAQFPPNTAYFPAEVMMPPSHYIETAYWINSSDYCEPVYHSPVPVVPHYLHTYMHQQSEVGSASPKPVLRADVEDFEPPLVRKVQVQNQDSLNLEAVSVELVPTIEVEDSPTIARSEESKTVPCVESCSTDRVVPSRSLASRMLRSSQSASITATPQGELAVRTPQPGIPVADFTLKAPVSPSTSRVITSLPPVIEPSNTPIPQDFVPRKIKGVLIGDEIRKALAVERLDYRNNPDLALDHRVSLGVIKDVVALSFVKLRDGFKSENFAEHSRVQSQRFAGKKVDGERVLHFTVQKGSETKTLRVVFRNRMVARRGGKELSITSLVTAFYRKDEPTVGTIKTQRFYSDISEVS